VPHKKAVLAVYELIKSSKLDKKDWFLVRYTEMWLDHRVIFFRNTRLVMKSGVPQGRVGARCLQLNGERFRTDRRIPSRFALAGRGDEPCRMEAVKILKNFPSFFFFFSFFPLFLFSFPFFF